MNLSQLKIGTRLALGYGLVVALLVMVVATACLRLQHLSRESTQLMELQGRQQLANDWSAQVHLNISRALAIAKSGGHKDVSSFLTPQMQATSDRISKLQADRLIRVGYDWIEIIDPARLRSLSGSIANDAAAPVTSTLWPPPAGMPAPARNLEPPSQRW